MTARAKGALLLPRDARFEPCRRLVGDAEDEARMKDLADGFFVRPVAPALPAGRFGFAGSEFAASMQACGNPVVQPAAAANELPGAP